MTAQGWSALLERLEADLRLRQANAGHPPDEAAWADARARLRRYGTIVSRLHGLDAQDAEDIVQTTLLKLQSPETLHRLRAAGSVEGYLFVMIRNRALDLARWRRRELVALGAMSASLPTVAAARAADRRAGALERELRLLSPEQRALLRLRFWDNLALRDIADHLGISYSAVAVRMFRLIRRLRERLGNP